MRALLAELGDPHLAVPVVHVAGTNGKGSTSSLAASVAQAAGRRVGLHTSPHLTTVRERMRTDGVPASEAWLDGAVARLAGALDRAGPSFFEATVALSFLSFAEQAVDLAVVEVGLGGRLDATNVVAPEVAVVTHVGLDHTDLLGGTVEAIAHEKAGVAKPGVPLVHAVEGPAAVALEAEARQRGATVEAVRESCRAEVVGPAPLRVRLATPAAGYGAVTVGLPGAHQAWNAALAVRAVEVASARLGWPAPTAEAVRSGLAQVAARSGLRGRGQAWDADPRVALDVAHNADGWRAALAALAVPPGGRLWVLAGVLVDKDADALAEALAGAAPAGTWALGLGGDRGLSADDLARVLAGRGVPSTPAASAADALDAFDRAAGADDRLLAVGSHQTVAAVLAARTRRGSTG